MKKNILIFPILAIIIFLFIVYLTDFKKTQIGKSVKCFIKNPNLTNYSFKICKYRLTTHPNSTPIKYQIENIKSSENVYIVRLRCCGTGDTVIIDKSSKEIIGYYLGDM